MQIDAGPEYDVLALLYFVLYTMKDRGHSQKSGRLHAFRSLKTALPVTKMGMVVALFAEIRELQRAGHKTRAIWETLRQDGIEMSYDLFRVYIGRAHRRLDRNGEITHAATDEADNITAPLPLRSSDPLAVIRQNRGQSAKERFEYDPLTPLKEDLLR